LDLKEIAMRTLLLAGVSSLLLGSPAMSATYYVDGSGTGAPEQTISQDTPVSISGGQEGTTFSGSATNVGGGSVSAFASEGISDITDYNNSAGSHYYGLESGVTAIVSYTIRVSGPVTGALVPVRINAIASAGSLDVPDPVSGYYAPIIAGTGADVQVQYAEGDAPVGASGFLAFIYADTNYDYRYFVDPGEGYAAPVLLGHSDSIDQEVLIAANFDVDVRVIASAGAGFESAYTSVTETAEGGASADPTFVIDEPGYSAYTIEGVPAGPAAVATPEPATWAMMLIGFAGLGFAGYRRGRRAAALGASIASTPQSERLTPVAARSRSRSASIAPTAI
jgi:hypothetical protein